MQHVKEVTAHKNNGSINVAHRVEKHYSHSYQFLQLVRPTEPTNFAKVVADLRVYITPTGATSVCLWLRDGGKSEGMSGRVGSNNVTGGYHKASAALAAALSMGGYQMAEGVSARGDEAMKEAVCAVLAHWGIQHVQILETHG